MPSLHSRAQAFPHTATKAGEQPRPPRGPGGSARCRSHPYHAIADPAPGLRARIRRPPLTAASGRSPEFTHVYCSACHDYCSERIPRTRKLLGSGCAGAVCLQCPSQSRFNFRLFLFLCSNGSGRHCHLGSAFLRPHKNRGTPCRDPLALPLCRAAFDRVPRRYECIRRSDALSGFLFFPAFRSHRYFGTPQHMRPRGVEEPDGWGHTAGKKIAWGVVAASEGGSG